MWLGFEAKGTVEDMRKAFNELKAKAQDVLILDVVRDISLHHQGEIPCGQRRRQAEESEEEGC